MSIISTFSCTEPMPNENEDYLQNFLRACEAEKKTASKDFRNGKRVWTIKGTVYADDFEMFYADYVKRKYKVIITSDCTHGLFQGCYVEAMNREIEIELGSDFFEKTWQEARNEYDSSHLTHRMINFRTQIRPKAPLCGNL